MFSGVLLAMHYIPHMYFAFNSIEFIMRDVTYGWLARYMHANGASMFFIVVYAHLLRGIYYGSYMKPRGLLWASGVVLLILMMGTAFTGYVLPWGQMSFWGATVITHMVTIVPRHGHDILEWFWGGYTIKNPMLQGIYIVHLFLYLTYWLLLFNSIKTSVATGGKRFKKFIRNIVYFIKFVMHLMLYFFYINIILYLILIMEISLQCTNFYSKDRSSKVYFYLCEYIVFWFATSSIFSRLRGLLYMLEGNGNIHFLITILFGSNNTFFGTVSATELEKTYITVGSLAINVRLLSSFKSRLETYVIGISGNKEMWEVYFYKLLIILLKDTLSNIGKYRSNSLYITRNANSILLRDAMCCLKDLNEEYATPIPSAWITSGYTPIDFWVDWLFCVYIAIIYIVDNFFRVMQVIQTFCLYGIFYYIAYYMYLIFLDWQHAVIFLLVTM